MTLAELESVVRNLVRVVDGLNEFNGGAIKAQTQVADMLSTVQGQLANLNERQCFLEDTVIDHAKALVARMPAEGDTDETTN